MMNCTDAREAMTGHDPRGGAPIPPGLEKHLDICPTCRSSWEDLQAADHLLSRWGESPLPVPPGLDARIMDAIRAEAAAPTAGGLSWRWLIPAVAAALVLFAVIRPTTQQPDTTSAGSPAINENDVERFRAAATGLVDLKGLIQDMPGVQAGRMLRGTAVAFHESAAGPLRVLGSLPEN